ncbi:competence ComEA-like helix-hairpin-helix protein [Runella defluvii]|uniref:Competence ComEA-like helix-hairpin-helix protein n=1 Tax=Runella defluvii TaxID=370973 RepID=A0A7W6ERR4_9BACT|nr:helix-hairpin-helix domain-containing protein [Runella defluvii]MBB3839777.1 competence ComEA-like helix-hairpin-helix protein [Runella defluvii]
MFQRLLVAIRDEFGVSRSQARGFMVLAALMVLCWFGPFLVGRLLPLPSSEISQADRQTADSLVAVLESIQPEQPTYSPKNYANYPSKTPESPRPLPEPFPFDPNTATIQQLQALGMPTFIAERIEKYRSKGGKFRKKEDLQRIYGLQPTLYQRLERYISLPAPSERNATTAASAPTSSLPAPPAFAKKAAPAPFDINTADTTQLIRLKGIGSKLAARIVKFRDGLGGFISVTQYNEIFGLDSLALSELNHWAAVRTPVQKININTASAEDIDRHPYISKRQAEIIVRYREQHGAYKSAQELLNIKILDEKLVSKIAPYLAF